MLAILSATLRPGAVGVVVRNNAADDDAQLIVVASHDLKPGKARVLLQLAILRPTDPVEVQKLFMDY